MKEEIEDILMNSYDKFGLFDESKATKELLNLFNDMKKNKKRKIEEKLRKGTQNTICEQQ